MFALPTTLRSRFWLCAVSIAIGVSGCASGNPLEDAGVQVAPSAEWKPIKAKQEDLPPAPRTTIAAWRGPENALFVVHRDLAIPGGDPASLETEVTTRLRNLPGLTLGEHKVETIAGRPAVKIELTAPGTGDALAPTSTGVAKDDAGRALSPTHRLTVGFVRKGDTLWLTWHYPETAAAIVKPTIERMLKSMTVQDFTASTSSY